MIEQYDIILRPMQTEHKAVNMLNFVDIHVEPHRRRVVEIHSDTTQRQRGDEDDASGILAQPRRQVHGRHGPQRQSEQ